MKTIGPWLPLVNAGLGVAGVVYAESTVGKVGFGLFTVWMLGEFGAMRK